MQMGQARRGVVDETCCEWMTFDCAKGQHNSCEILSHTHVREKVKVPDTDNTEKNVRATRCSVFISRRVHDIRQGLYAKSVKQILCGFERDCCHHSFHQL